MFAYLVAYSPSLALYNDHNILCHCVGDEKDNIIVSHYDLILPNTNYNEVVNETERGGIKFSFVTGSA